ncbi:MAG: hypothetical protein A2Y62_15025 [Candidatus Fischerbacteria bacterium RBG_13_37_8]|uniref:DivIVA domain-containing protein n=1 Tax=Candidatus Fischerbacteria bacterium RBG_13_37_8 TaxID=1817863 RepID=A0A1F5V533_9BACT|nr:MAG: hypothetical protein A2Y62_15025 [Candidatus Fischerbacteria bacterium RBG_13_37_8]
MKLAPMDIQKQRFTIKFRGYDVEEVHTFLSAIAEQMEQMLKENSLLAKDIDHLKDSLEEYQERENILKNTLVTAQKASDQLKENAQKESQILVKEAELKAINILEAAQKQLLKLQEDILQSRLRKKHMQENILAQIESLKQLISMQKEEEEKDKKLSYFMSSQNK